MSDARQQHIEDLHAAFCHATGLKITLDYGKRQSWAFWLDYRKGPDQFTLPDLIFVIGALQRQILKREMFPEALNFYSFIAPDKFEIRLEQFRKAERNARKPLTNREQVLKATHRQTELMPDPVTPHKLLAGDDLKARLDALRKAAG